MSWIRDGVNCEKIYPPEMIRIARDRIKDLLHRNIIEFQPIGLLLESAYLQGIVDGAQAVKEQQEPDK